MAEHESERLRRLIAYSLHSYIYYTQKDAFRYYGGIFLCFDISVCSSLKNAGRIMEPETYIPNTY